MTPERKFAFTADNHLRRCTWTGRPSLIGDAYIGFAQVIEHCLNNRLNLVLGGDVLDSSSPPSEALCFLREQVARMTTAGLVVFAIDGNHDRVELDGNLPDRLQRLDAVTPVSPSWATLVDGLRYVDRMLFEPAPGVMAFGLTYRSGESLQRELADVDPLARILVCHQMMDWAMPIEGRFNYQAEWTPEFINLVLLGDYHVACTQTVGNALYAYSGSTSMQDISEPPAKSFLEVTLADDGTFHLERIPILSRPFHSVTISTEADLERFEAWALAELSPDRFAHLPELIRSPLVRVTYHVDVPDVVNRVTLRMPDPAGLWLTPFTLEGDTAVMAPGGDSVVVRDVMADLINPTQYPESFNLACELVEGGDPRATLERFRSECGVSL